MVEKILKYSINKEKIIEKVLEDDNVGINHMILPEGESLPLHYANSNVYMIVVKGIISLKLDEGSQNNYPAGNILVIPFKTHMNVFNENREEAEIFVVKSPSPSKM